MATTWEDYSDEVVAYARDWADHATAVETFINNGKVGTPPDPPGLEQPTPPGSPL